MHGGAHLYRPADMAPTVTEIAAVHDRETLKALLDGGWLEAVPGFTRYPSRAADRLVRCAAFCDEEGKMKDLPVNEMATMLWHAGLQPAQRIDVLVGPVVVVFGDAEFMRA